MTADDTLLCHDCGHHIHRPGPCGWTFGTGSNEWRCPCSTADDTREALERAIIEHRDSIWPAQLRATGDGGGWTYEAHLARYIDMSLAAARRDPEPPCADCHESASGVCTRHNGSFALGEAARRDPEDADAAYWREQAYLARGRDPEPVASADAPTVSKIAAEYDARLTAPIRDPEPVASADALRDVMGRNHWFVARVSDASWVESKEWVPAIEAAIRGTEPVASEDALRDALSRVAAAAASQASRPYSEDGHIIGPDSLTVADWRAVNRALTDLPFEAAIRGTEPVASADAAWEAMTFDVVRNGLGLNHAIARHRLAIEAAIEGTEPVASADAAWAALRTTLITADTEQERHAAIRKHRRAIEAAVRGTEAGTTFAPYEDGSCAHCGEGGEYHLCARLASADSEPS